MNSFSKRLSTVTKRQWIRASFWGVLYILFVLWVAWSDWKSLAWLILLPFVIDTFTTKYINWGWWRRYRPAAPGETPNPKANAMLYTICSWVDAIVFALVAVYFINLYFFQNYQIPSSSLEKSLRVGDFLFVSKASYGPRIPNTPLSMPLTQHTMPNWLGGGASYIENPQWEYKRLKGWDHPKKYDIVVFNFPAGDTVYANMQQIDAYSLRYQIGAEYAKRNNLDVSTEQLFAIGEAITEQNSRFYGQILTRPVDRRENYVKRCVGEPGDTLQIIDNQVYVNNVILKDVEGVQYNYYVSTDGYRFTDADYEQLGINKDDRRKIGDALYCFPLTRAMKAQLEQNEHVRNIVISTVRDDDVVYPLGYTNWTRDNYGPIYIPRRGDKILITEDNYHIYKRVADAYEHQPIQIGEEYEFKMDYYWMMGDNRHNSSDSRYWGFVPEDHIVGRPVFIWLSLEKDKKWFEGRIRWNRLFRGAVQ